MVASGRHWRLRAYAGPDARPSLLIVSAPIKRPYIWDLAPSVSAVRHCLRRGSGVYLLEWTPPGSEDGAGLDEYAGDAIGEAAALVSREAQGAKPALIGHSLGGTLAAIFGAYAPDSIRALALLGAPLCFRAGTSRFRDALVTLAPGGLAAMQAVPGSLVSQLGVLASPGSFLWSRWADAVASLADPEAWDIHMRVERWALDEVPVSGRLVDQILQGLYRDDRFCGGTLPVRGRTVGPSSLHVPTLAVVNTADDIASPASVTPFLRAMPNSDVRLLEYGGEIGVGLQHVAILTGRRAYAHVWPEIFAWLERWR
ncbi:alpha/beta fold hydrolase [Chelatococcus sp. SYSU_G07232]|uniref:Alpha/beta fold hydrolase n=1 Tax=Chelatococcus albus TaxID=3047466 RepID=A0ABT7AMX5_9HYPH|nr:alpha/beta fold hydrolase [Chelatococcus sp. SYSU_G07232]MDJ1159911.1 alpha/beta fold hydrolase [Chelatococcus sp. SYSU_G07232]